MKKTHQSVSCNLKLLAAILSAILACPSAKGQRIGLFALKTNLIEWSAAVPNVSVFTDLSARPWNRSAAGITFKYKWKTRETYAPSFFYNLLEVRPEYRYYLKNLYFGAYAAYDSYATQLPAWKEARQGNAWGGGVSAGWEMPLYTYRRGALDLDLGASVGLHYTNGRVVPYPELRASLVWRKTSVKEKYREGNPMDAVFDKEKEAIRINYGVTNLESFEAIRQRELKIGQDSVLKDLYGGETAAYLADYRRYFQESFVDMALEAIRGSSLDKRYKNRLRTYVNKLTRQAMADGLSPCWAAPKSASFV